MDDQHDVKGTDLPNAPVVDDRPTTGRTGSVAAPASIVNERADRFSSETD
ncbi:MAG TPA: hypothetical protein PLR25_04820 [Planctomycetaceae bacterium]|nr:hypothetical protein [Planctomycetaceae bacterium]